ncbi:MAG TPA: hypothetical protein VKS79_21075 [Gemmataceae bacterium]|nr:hypothetical protein [Gemmataceae bacterium]
MNPTFLFLLNLQAGPTGVPFDNLAPVELMPANLMGGAFTEVDFGGTMPGNDLGGEMPVD